MSYVRSFANDIFISFSHIDNSDAWVEKFHQRLKDRLAQIDVKAEIWRDKKLRGIDDFSAEIFDGLKDSALLVSIVSPAGIKSRWCTDERQKFEQFAATKGGFKVGNILRAVKVVKTPLDDDAHRGLFGSTLGYDFYERDDQSKIFYEFDPDSPEFKDRINELAQHLKSALNQIRAAAPQPDRLSVYLAWTTSDLESQRLALSQQMEDWGCAVLPAGSLPFDSPSFRASVSAALEEADLSVHLVSSQRGLILDEEEKSIVALQYELAEARKFDRILWVQPGSKPDASLQTTIEQGPQEGLERLEDQTLEYLKEIIEGKLSTLRKTPPTKDATERPSVYLVCHPQDNPYVEGTVGDERVRDLESYLIAAGLTVSLPPVNFVEEKLRRKDHRETIKSSDGVVLYWRDPKLELWFRENVRELDTARRRRSRSRRIAEAIYLSPPPSPAKTPYRNRKEFLLIEQYDTFQPDAFKPLLTLLKDIAQRQ